MRYSPSLLNRADRGDAAGLEGIEEERAVRAVLHAHRAQAGEVDGADAVGHTGELRDGRPVDPHLECAIRRTRSARALPVDLNDVRPVGDREETGVVVPAVV